MAKIEPANPEFWAQVCVSLIFIVAGFAMLMFGLGEQGTAKMAAGRLGAVLGFWLR